jgi:hypothetical protein
MKAVFNQILAGAGLLFLAFLLGLLHLVFFHDLQTLLFYLFLNVVFMPVEVLLVSLIIQGLLNWREKKNRMNKLNMVVEVFFSEVGTPLIKILIGFAPVIQRERERMIIGADWDERHFRQFRRDLRQLELEIDCRTADLDELRNFLISKRDFLLRLLENQQIMEHETFTDLLWAVFHLAEELGQRISCSSLGSRDREHLAKDIQRVYLLLIYEWLGYMLHLKNNYPFLFSLAVRTNPFDPEAAAEIKE